MSSRHVEIKTVCSRTIFQQWCAMRNRSRRNSPSVRSIYLDARFRISGQTKNKDQNTKYTAEKSDLQSQHCSTLQLQTQLQLQPHYITQHYATLITLHCATTTTAAAAATATATTTTTTLHYFTLHYITLHYITLH